MDVGNEAEDRPEKMRMGILGEIGNVLFKGVIEILNTYVLLSLLFLLLIPSVLKKSPEYPP